MTKTKAKDRRAIQQANSAKEQNGGYYTISVRDFEKLLKDWGWALDVSAQGSHHKLRWNGHQVNFPGTKSSKNLPGQAVERAAAVMGMSVTELLTGPILGNPGVAKAITAAAQTQDGWKSTGDRLHTDPTFRVPWDEGDDLGYEVDLTADVDWESDVEPTPTPIAAPTSTYPLDCPTCDLPLIAGQCSQHGRPLVLPDPDAPVEPYHIDAYLDTRFLDLDAANRRVYLAIQRRLVADGVLSEDDLKSPQTTPTARSYTAGTAGAITPSKQKESPVSQPPTYTPHDARPPAPRTAQERGAAAAVTNKANQAKRIAAALPPGKAATIDQVLDRTTGPITDARRRILDVLVDHDGYSSHKDGKATTILCDWVNAKYPGSYVGARASGLSNLLKNMEADKQIKRAGNSKRTHLITIVDPLDVEFVKRGKGAGGFEVKDEEVPITTPEPESTPTPEPAFTPAEEPLDLPEPEPEPAPVAEPAPKPVVDVTLKRVTPIAPATPTITVTSTDDDLWEVLDLLTGNATLPFTRETITDFNVWCDATRRLLGHAK